MKNKLPLRHLSKKYLPVFITILLVVTSCMKEVPYSTATPANDQLVSITYSLQKIDSPRYWGDSEKIRLTTAMIRLFPEYHTYEKKLIGTADESIDPAQADWTKESSGKYSFSADSAFLILDHDPGQIRYFPGKNLTPPRLEQYDSVWYTISFYSMAVSGNFLFTAAP